MIICRRNFLAASLVLPFMCGGRAIAGGELFPINMKEGTGLEYKFQRRDMAYDSAEPAGTLVVDPHRCFLYHVLGGGQATRYGVSVGKSAMAWAGEVTINKMTAWPIWIPAPYHIQHKPALAKYLPGGMPGGPDNPMGARALYLFKGEVDTVNRIHGAAKVVDIGQKHTAGCIGMLNVDVAHLYSQVQIGTRVVMLA